MRVLRYGRAIWITAALLAMISGSLVGIDRAAAQVIISSTVNGTTVTERDSAGNTYTFDLTQVGGGTLVVNQTSPGGQVQTAILTVAPAGGSLFTVSGNSFGVPINCTVDVHTQQVVTGSCGVLSGTNSSALVAANTATALQGEARSQTLAVTTVISDRIRAISRDLARSLAAASQPQRSSYRGLAAGSADARWGVWGDASGAFLRNDTVLGYDGTSVIGLVGIDYVPGNDWVFGATAGYTRADLTLRSIPGTKTTDGAVVGPYVSYIIGSNASIDGQAQYTALFNRVAAPIAGLTSNFTGNRVTGALNLNVYADQGPFKLTGFGGYAFTWEGNSIPAALTGGAPALARNTRYGVIKIGGEAGYLITPALEAYVPLTFLFETTTPRDGTSRAAIQIGGGLRYQIADNVKLGFNATTIEAKSHTRDVRIVGNVRWTF
jgi:hypothetical protein